MFRYQRLSRNLAHLRTKVRHQGAPRLLSTLSYLFFLLFIFFTDLVESWLRKDALN